MKPMISVLLILLFLLLPFSAANAGRYYDGRIGRWTTPDPILNEKHPLELLQFQNGMLLSTSPYGYVYNNPMKFIDENGKVPFLAPAVGGGAAIYVGGAVTIAVVGHTYNYAFNPAYRDAVNRGTTSLSNVANEAFDKSTATIQEGYDATKEMFGNIFLSENKKWKGQVEGWVEGPVADHLNRLMGNDASHGSPNDPQNRNDWRSHVQKALDNISGRLKKLGKSLDQVLKERGWKKERIDELMKRLKDNDFDVPSGVE